MPVGCACMHVCVHVKHVWACVADRLACVARRGHGCQCELAGLAVGRPNNRLQRVRGAFNASKHTGRAAAPKPDQIEELTRRSTGEPKDITIDLLLFYIRS